MATHIECPLQIFFIAPFLFNFQKFARLCCEGHSLVFVISGKSLSLFLLNVISGKSQNKRPLITKEMRQNYDSVCGISKQKIRKKNAKSTKRKLKEKYIHKVVVLYEFCILIHYWKRSDDAIKMHLSSNEMTFLDEFVFWQLKMIFLNVINDWLINSGLNSKKMCKWSNLKLKHFPATFS